MCYNNKELCSKISAHPWLFGDVEQIKEEER